MCHESKLSKFLERLAHHFKRSYNLTHDSPNLSKFNPEVGRIITRGHYDRLTNMLDEALQGKNAKLFFGGKTSEKDLYISPTVVLNPDLDSKMMNEEIFGPILPILTFQSMDEVINDHIRKRDKPLVVYYSGSTSSPNWNRLLEQTSSGAISANGLLDQVLAIDLGFGGVGKSGHGRFGGYEGFKQWSNPKAVVEKCQLNIWPLTEITPPYTGSKRPLLRFLLGLQWLKQKTFIKWFFLVLFFGYFLLTSYITPQDSVSPKQKLVRLLIKLLENFK